MTEADQKFSAAARDWLNTVADEQEAERRMMDARDVLDACRKKRTDLENTLGGFVGHHLTARAASCGRYSVLVEFNNPMGPARVRRIPTIKAGVDAP